MSVTADVSYLFRDLQRASFVIRPCIFDELKRNGQCLRAGVDSGMNLICDRDKVDFYFALE